MIQRCLLHGLLILLACLCTNPIGATGADALIQSGDNAYAHKAYDSAEYYYRQAIGINNSDAVLLYKLGNVYFRLNHVGEAVLAYERALKRRPGFAEASENLDIIQRRIQPDREKDEVFFVRWWRELTRPSRSNAWAILGVICFCFPLGILAWSRFARKRISWLQPQLIVSGVVLGMLFAILAAAGINRAADNVAVVMRPGALLNMAFKGASTARTGGTANLPEGLIVKVLRKEVGGLLIALPDGREGLIQNSDIALVE